MLDAAPDDYVVAPALDVASCMDAIEADQTLPTGRHLVIADPRGRHRIWLRAPPDATHHVVIVAPDVYMPVRDAFAQRLIHRLLGQRTAPTPAALWPTDFQRKRLTLLLALLDAATVGRASTRGLATTIVYPDLDLHGDDWRGANERRRVQRLVEEARSLAAGGYRDLLHGRPKP